MAVNNGCKLSQGSDLTLGENHTTERSANAHDQLLLNSQLTEQYTKNKDRRGC